MKRTISPWFWVVTILGVASLFFYGGLPRKRHQHLKAYFAEGNSIKSGAPVRLAGVDIGRVDAVTLRPEMKSSPVEVQMAIITDYRLDVPTDAVVTLKSTGVFGEICPEISISEAKGPPAQDWAVLPSRETKLMTTEELLNRITEMAKESKNSESQKQPQKK